MCSAVPFGWFEGMLRVCPLPSVGQWSEEGYQSSIKQGAVPALRVMSHWAERGGGKELVTWLMADLPLQWRGEASYTTSRCPVHSHTHADVDTTLTHNLLTDNPCSFHGYGVLTAFKNGFTFALCQPSGWPNPNWSICIDLGSNKLSCSLSWAAFYHVSQSSIFFAQPVLLSEPISSTHYLLFSHLYSILPKMCPSLYCDGKSLSFKGMLLFAVGTGMSHIFAWERNTKMFCLSRPTQPSMNTPLLTNPVHHFVYLKSTPFFHTALQWKCSLF